MKEYYNYYKIILSSEFNFVLDDVRKVENEIEELKDVILQGSKLNRYRSWIVYFYVRNNTAQKLVIEKVKELKNSGLKGLQLGITTKNEWSKGWI